VVRRANIDHQRSEKILGNALFFAVIELNLLAHSTLVSVSRIFTATPCGLPIQERRHDGFPLSGSQRLKQPLRCFAIASGISGIMF
jgi:hypothetical protein